MSSKENYPISRRRLNINNSGRSRMRRVANTRIPCRFFPVLFFLLLSGCASLGGVDEKKRDFHQSEPHPLIFAQNEQKEDAPEELVVPDVEPLVVGYEEFEDPLINLNRAIFAFNDVSYRYVLIPISNGYMKVTNEPVREGISNFFENIKTPIYLVNHLLQWEINRAGLDIFRFGINSTLGLFGIFDPAADWFEIERRETHFEDTLSDWGTGPGVYLVLPFWGPSDTRNAVSQVTDIFLNPIRWTVEQPESTVIQTFDFVQDYAPEADRYLQIRKESDDPYIFFRNLYLQGKQRDEDIKTGR